MRRRRESLARTRLAPLLCLALTVMAVRAAAGNVNPGDHGTVRVAVAASDAEATRILAALDDLAARLGLGIRASHDAAPPWGATGAPPAPTEPGDRARVWIDARDDDVVDIDVCGLHSGMAASCVHRRVPRSGSSAVVAEQVAHVVYVTLESELLTEASPPEPSLLPPATPPAPMPPSYPQPLAPAPLSAPRPSARPHRETLALDAAAFLNGRMLAQGTRVDLGGGGAIVVSAPMFLRPSLWLSAAIQAPFNANGSGLALETTVSSFRAIPAIETVHLPALHVDVGAGGGADVFRSTPIDSRFPGPQPGPTTHVSPVFTAQLLARLRLGPSARLVGGLDIDWSPGQRRYEVLGPSGASNVAVAPWTVRPGGLLGLCIPSPAPARATGQSDRFGPLPVTQGANHDRRRAALRFVPEMRNDPPGIRRHADRTSGGARRDGRSRHSRAPQERLRSLRVRSRRGAVGYSAEPVVDPPPVVS